MMHREKRDFTVLIEHFDSGSDEHDILGCGGDGIEVRHTLLTTHEGVPERWAVRSITRNAEQKTWSATVVPAPALTAVA
ncbi:hypothetical protein ACLBWX_18405 [Methylobacterium sp. M6A4_1b]